MLTKDFHQGQEAYYEGISLFYSYSLLYCIICVIFHFLFKDINQAVNFYLIFL